MEYKLNFDSFKEGLSEGKLLGLKCNDCGAYTAPPRKVCAECGSENMDVVTLSGKGTIQTFTTIYVAPEGFTPPFVVAMAELDEGPWLMGDVEGIDPEKADMELIGKRVTVGYKDVPADMISGGDRTALTFKLEG